MNKWLYITAFFLSKVSLAQLPSSTGLAQLQNEQNSQVKQNNNAVIHHQNNSAKSYLEVENIKAEAKKEKVKPVKASQYRFVDVNSPAYKANSSYYTDAYSTLNKMLSSDTGLSIKRGVYVIENAYMEKKLPYDKYLSLIQKKVSLVKYILKKEKLDEANPDAIHYAIQKLYLDTLYFKQANGTMKMVKPLRYDFNNPFGEDEQLVTKLLVTGKGQCHSMPLLYMILCEEFNIKSYVAYSPQHSFIKFQTKNGTWYNFETTNGHLTTDAFIFGSGFIKSEALKSGIFNTPQNSKQVLANMFIDLANNYQEKFGYDDFQQKCVEKNLQYNTNYVYAKVVRSNYQTALTDLALAQEGYPNPKYIPQYPYISQMFQTRNEYYKELDNLGFTNMPQDAYMKWISSLKEGQEKQNSQELQDQFQNTVNLKK